MRLNITISPSRQVVPFVHQRMLAGVIHKWIGENEEHGALSLYSFSRLINAQKGGGGLVFPKGTSFFISAYDRSLLHRIIKGVQKDPTMFGGLVVDEVQILSDPDLSETSRFCCGSPLFVKENVGNNQKHLLYNDPRSNEVMRRILCKKMDSVGYEYGDFEIYFDQAYPRASTKIIKYKSKSREIANRCNICPVIIKGDQRVKQFAWNVGLGSSTGIGFGAITATSS